MGVDSQRIRDAEAGDITDVVRVHQAAFPRFLMTMLGPKFLHVYYQAVLDSPGRVFLVAVDADGTLCGFVAGYSDPRSFYQLFSARKKRVMLSALAHVAVRPSTWLRVLENMRQVNRLAEDHSALVSAELASIAVDPLLERRGCGKQLVRAFLERAHQLHADQVVLTTDAKGNDAVNAFYTRLGFLPIEQFARSGGRLMNKYELKIS